MSRTFTSASERGLFSGSLAWSIGLHAALAALVLLGVSWRQPAPPPVLTVSLVAPESARPGSGGSSASAGAPEAKKAAPGAPAAALAPPASPATKPKPVKRPKPRAQPIPPPQPQPVRPEQVMPAPPPRPKPPPVVQAPRPPKPVAPQSASPSSSPVPTTGAATGGRGGTAGTAPAGAGSGTARSAVLGYGHGGRGGGGNPAAAQRHYLKLIRARILAQRKYPYMARQRRQEGVVRLRFTLSSAGSLSQGVQVVKPSGHNLLDEQARQCVLAAAPFPPFPLGLQRERLSVELPIIYKISDLER